ncbi:MAG: MBG domain-containing protein [Pseudobacter sp.]|uniref:MBG domain-containing protein n=1 Tax=Pseudobacter sp. TaxID=2045420 RepID=UPI003F808641
MFRKFSPIITLLVLLCLSFSARAQVEVTASAGLATATYSTLKEAFDGINDGTHKGAITILVDGFIVETAPSVLNASGSGGSNFTSVLIQPRSSTIITGDVFGNPLITLKGSNNVTIDGSVSGTDTRDLIIENTSATASNVLLIGSVGTTPINNVTIKNTMLINGTNTTTAVFLGNAASLGLPGYFSNITIQNNSITKAYIGIYAYAVVGPLVNDLSILENDLNSTDAEAIRMVGVYAQGVDGLEIRNNNIGNFDGTDPEYDRAIWLATATKNTVVTDNTISGMHYTGMTSHAPAGLTISTGIANSNIVISNNSITDLSSSGTYLPMGIFVYSFMSDLLIRNNRISNIRNLNAAGYGAAGIHLAPSSASANFRVYNNFIRGITSYGKNGSGVNDNANGIVVDDGGGISIDFNTIAMNANPVFTGSQRNAAMLITSNVTAAGSIQMRSNILANLQTVGDGNSAPAFVLAANTNVLGVSDFNIFHSAKGNLLFNGVANSATISGLQAALGNNANSLSVLPVFLGTDDIHLNPGNNTALEGKGQPVAGITTDIDGEIRDAAAPDPGADEFVFCPAPVITADPSPLSLPLGDAGSFSITATGAAPITYQWQVSPAGSGAPVFTDLVNDGIYDDVNTATLKILSADISMNGNLYRCMTSNACGVNIYSTPAVLTITKMSQSLTFDALTDGSTITRTYGDPDVNAVAYSSASLMVTYTTGDPAVAVIDAAGQVTITGAGTTTITASQSGDAAYLPATDISITIVVNRLDITVYADRHSKTYGDYDPSFSYTVSPALIGADVFTGSSERAPGENVGTYAIEQSTLTAGNNYNMTFYGNIMEILPRELTVTADDQIRDYGAPNPALTLTYSNFGFTDDETVLTRPVMVSTIASSNSIPGDYPIDLSGAASRNYTFVYVPGKLTIRPVQLQVDQQPNAATICADERASFNTAVTVTPGVAPVDYQWQYSVDGINGWQDLSQGHSATYSTRANSTTGFIRCKFTVPGADFYSDPAPLNINQLPVIRVNKSNDIDCASTSARLLATGGVSYLWSPVSGLDNPAIANPVVTTDRSTSYLVTGTDANGCRNTARIMVNVIPREYNVPNAFTPNNDGKNDCWGVSKWQKVTQFSVTVMNRNGVPVFQSNDVSRCWDGTFKGEPQPSGSFVYYIRCVTPCGAIERKGSFVLIR